MLTLEHHKSSFPTLFRCASFRVHSSSHRHSRLNRDILLLGEDLQDREEVRAGGRVAFAKHWSVFGSAIVDLTQQTDDPLSSADGFEPIRHRLGVAYDDDCLSIALTWRRDYADTGDARRGNSFSFRIAFRNLGF